MKWEYKIADPDIGISTTNAIYPSLVQAFLDLMGKDGWELVQAIVYHPEKRPGEPVQMRYIFKRPVTELTQ